MHQQTDLLRRLISRMLAPVRHRVMAMVRRTVVKLVDDSLKFQGLQVQLLDGQVADGVEKFEPYGLTSHPFAGAEGVFLAVGGNRAHGIVINVGDRRYRMTGLEEGEVALYDDQGSYVHLQRDGKLELKSVGDSLHSADGSNSVHGATGLNLDSDADGHLSTVGAAALSGATANVSGNTTTDISAGVAASVVAPAVNLGTNPGTDFVALATPTLSNFTALVASFNALVAAYTAHVHVTTATIGPSPVVGELSPPAVPGVPAVPPVPITTAITRAS